MSALRLARGYTKKNKIIKFEGCYHGHSDSMLVKAGSGAMTFGDPDSAGVTKGAAEDTLLAKYNDLTGTWSADRCVPLVGAGRVIDNISRGIVSVLGSENG